MNIYSLEVGISTVYKFANRRERSDPRESPYFLFDVFYCPIHEYVWFRGGDFDHFQVLKQKGVTSRTPPIVHSICCIVPYMNIYGLWVGITTVYKFPNRRVGVTPGTLPISFHLPCFIITYQ